MENQTHQTFALKVKIHYSDRNIQKLKERFLRFDGVDEVEVEAQHELVIITGTVHPQMLISYLEGKDVEAELYTYSESDSPKNANPEKPNAGGTGEGKKHEKESKKKKKKKSKKPKEEEEEEEDDHVAEPYEALKIDPLFCKDPYCKTHKSRPPISSKVPSINSEDHPRHNHHGHGHGPSLSFGNNAPMFAGAGPFPCTGLGRFPMMPPYYPAFGFPPARNYMPGFGNFRRPFAW